MSNRSGAWDCNSGRGIAQLMVAFSVSIVVTLVCLNRDQHEFTVSEDIVQKSCLSRDASSSYRKSTPQHTPSPHLVAKLKSYEALHRRCGPKTRDYKGSMQAAFASNSRNSSCSYIIWTPSQGLGNQMVSMVSAFLYALLTNRVLLVDFGPDLADLFCEPFLGSYSSWIMPQDFPHKRTNFRHFPTFLTLMEKIRNDQQQNPTTRNRQIIPLPSFLYLNLDSGSLDRVNYFHCDESHDLLNKIPVVVTKSDLYYAPSLFITPSFIQELDRLFPQKTTVFYHLGRYLFHPSDQAWQHITHYYDTNHLADADLRVGLQIRVVNRDAVSRQVMMDQILDCTHKHRILSLLPDHLTGNKSSSTKTTSVAILVASLFPEYAKNLTATYVSNSTTTTTTGSSGQVIRVHQPSSDGRQKFHSGKQNMKAWVEMYLLSLSDKLVTTGESTFGYVAEGLGGLKPWVLTKPQAGHSTAANTSVSCWRAPTFDPCFEFPPRFDCKARREVDYVGRLFPQTIKMCEDRYGWGIRLTDGD